MARRARRALAVSVSAAVFAGAPVPARGQVFLASTPHPQFSIGPLFIVATVTPGLGPVTVLLEEEQHEVEIALEGDLVRNVHQSRVRRMRLK